MHMLENIKQVAFNGNDTYIRMYQGSEMLWEKETEDVDYFYVTPASPRATVFSFTTSGDSNPDIEYSYDKLNWTKLEKDVGVTVSGTDKLYLRGDNPDGLSTSNVNTTTFKATLQWEVGGDVTTLINKKGNVETLPQYCFRVLFYGSTTLRNSSELRLPSKEIGISAYVTMFGSCTALLDAPKEILCETLGRSCMQNMFQKCSALLYGPDALYAKKAVNNCYFQMFQSCTNLIKAPDIYIETFSDDACLNLMFNDCKSLVNPPKMFVKSTSNSTNAMRGMFTGCTALKSAPDIYVETVGSNSFYNTFSGCTSLEQAMVLPAKKLESGCYTNLFRSCKKVNYITALFETLPSTSYTSNWVSGVSSTGTFVKNINATWTTTGASGVPTGWNVIYFDPSTEKYWLEKTKITECDKYGNPLPSEVPFDDSFITSMGYLDITDSKEAFADGEFADASAILGVYLAIPDGELNETISIDGVEDSIMGMQDNICNITTDYVANGSVMSSEQDGFHFYEITMPKMYESITASGLTNWSTGYLKDNYRLYVMK